ncbi:hypothetical protein GPECTOR_132g592 [Gonium pectorale]|uniref:RAP domain-containing protein n=1 Tax=Gonium pectorale TaxID=33097 RepID=A0A150FZT4_GONPE|nr:hypothetical protein GPECTOR_132g592 [Gonium pectorale]|eukprot:KXZ42580.1 hypothetical protein GPECTOR_132g592 [Gonium pectorale]
MLPCPNKPKHQVLEVCRLVAKRVSVMGGYSTEQLVSLIEALASRCRGDADEGPAAREVAGRLVEAALGRGWGLPGSRLASAGDSRVPPDVPRLLPRLLPALAALEYEEQDAWETATRLMQSQLPSYSGTQLALLVQALADVGGPVQRRQLEHPAMTLRLQALAQEAALPGDVAAAVLLGLCESGSLLPIEALAALLSRALRDPGLAPVAWVQLLRSVSRYCERFSDGATEVMALLCRIQEGLVEELVQGATQALHKAPLPPHSLTDAALSFCRLRYHQPAFLEMLATRATQGLKAGELANRDVTTALYACATFGHRSPAVTELFAAAAASMGRRLGALSPAALARLAWSFAVGGGCGLLPHQERPPRNSPAETVEHFMRELAKTLRERQQELVASREACGLLEFALRIWSTSPHHQHLVDKQLLRAVLAGMRPPPASARPQQQPSGGAGEVPVLQRPGTAGGGGGGGGGPLVLQRPGGVGGGSGGGGSGGGGGGGWGAKGSSSVSELQKEVYRHLAQLGYPTQMEATEGLWSVDIRLKVGSVRVALEVDGPSHYTTSQPPLRLGATVARDACLAHLGLRVVSLNYLEYRSWPPEGRQRALRRVVEAAAAADADAGPAATAGPGTAGAGRKVKLKRGQS